MGAVLFFDTRSLGKGKLRGMLLFDGPPSLTTYPHGHRRATWQAWRGLVFFLAAVSAGLARGPNKGRYFFACPRQRAAREELGKRIWRSPKLRPDNESPGR